MTTLETKINDRIKDLEAETAAAQKAEAEKLATQKREFEAACQELSQIATNAGAKSPTPATFGETSIPYVSFTVSGVPVAIENRDGDLTLLVNGKPLEVRFSTAQENLTDDLEATIVEAIAQAVHSGEVQLAAPTTSRKGAKEAPADAK